MNYLGKVLLVEDDPNHVELTLMALAENRLANEVLITRDGEEALNYLYRRGPMNRGRRGTHRWCSWI
jgi:CheY-like chemotaxis protein